MGNLATAEGYDKDTRKAAFRKLYNFEVKPSKVMSDKEKNTLKKVTQEAMNKITESLKA